MYASDSLATELSVVGLRIVEVQPDGNCLFRALADQLQVRLPPRRTIATSATQPCVQSMHQS